jgi:hypothetical protein
MPSADLPSVTPLEGATTVDTNMLFEPERLGYASAADLAGLIAESCKTHVTQKSVVIAGTDLLADLANLQACYFVLDDLTATYNAIIEPANELAEELEERTSKHRRGTRLGVVQEAGVGTVAAAPPLAIGATAINAALGLAALLRENVTYTGRPTKVDQLAFQLALASEIKGQGATNVIVPALMTFAEKADAKSESKSESEPVTPSLQERLASLREARGAVWTVTGPLVARLVLLEGELVKAQKAEDKATVNELTTQIGALRRTMEPIVAPLDRADRRLGELESEWNKAEPSTGITLLARLLRAEMLRSRPNVYLHAFVVSSGGHYRIAQSLWRTIFSGDGLSFQGGAVARWAILQGDGSVLAGGIVSKSREG